MSRECDNEGPGRLIPPALLAAGLMLVGSSALAQSMEDWPSRLTLATGPTGGFAYTMGSPWAATVSSDLGIPISPESTAGMPINVEMVNAGMVEIAFTTSDIAIQGVRGEGFADGEEQRDFRTFLMFDPNVFQLYTDASSDIHSLSDLSGHVVNPSRAGSGSDMILRGIVAALNLEPADIVNVSPAQANDLMADGRVHAAVGTGNVPHPAPSQYEARTPIRLLGFTEEELEIYLDQNPQLTRMVIPAGTYANQEQDVVSVGSYIMLIANKDVPESLVYELIKSTFDNQDDLASAYSAYGKLVPENITRSPIPLHPGAVRYFEERGVEIPDELKPSAS